MILVWHPVCASSVRLAFMRRTLKDPKAGMVRDPKHRHRRTRVPVMFWFSATAAVPRHFARQRPVAGLPRQSAAPEAARVAPASDADSLYVAARPGRPSYRYSVIPGRVGSGEELRQIAELVLIAVPVSILANAFRIAVTRLVVQHSGLEGAQGTLPLLSGWLTFAF
jgi:Transmembrane exosortase (Exosortase_EpsH)